MSKSAKLTVFSSAVHKLYNYLFCKTHNPVSGLNSLILVFYTAPLDHPEHKISSHQPSRCAKLMILSRVEQKFYRYLFCKKNSPFSCLNSLILVFWGLILLFYTVILNHPVHKISWCHPSRFAKLMVLSSVAQKFYRYLLCNTFWPFSCLDSCILVF